MVLLSQRQNFISSHQYNDKMQSPWLSDDKIYFSLWGKNNFYVLDLQMNKNRINDSKWRWYFASSCEVLLPNRNAIKNDRQFKMHFKCFIFYLFQQIRSINIKFTSSLYNMFCTILTFILCNNVTAKEYGNKGARWKSFFVGLETIIYCSDTIKLQRNKLIIKFNDRKLDACSIIVMRKLTYVLPWTCRRCEYSQKLRYGDIGSCQVLICNCIFINWVLLI